MCGRTFFYETLSTLVDEFGITAPPMPSNWPARYNMPPTLDMPVVRYNRETGQRHLDLLRWGFIPPSSTEGKEAIVNARAETITEKPMFAKSFRARRCLVTPSGFYEWRREGKTKLPHAIRMASGKAMPMAGIWTAWKRPGTGDWIRTCAVITCGPNALMAAIHDRMPVILDRRDWPRWLGEEAASEAELLDLLRPCPDDWLAVTPLRQTVNDVRNDGPDCLVPLAAA